MGSTSPLLLDQYSANGQVLDEISKAAHSWLAAVHFEEKDREWSNNAGILFI
ncbi:MAG: hypothetical protein AAF600_06695 [Bacteroidota bacterium]